MMTMLYNVLRCGEEAVKNKFPLRLVILALKVCEDSSEVLGSGFALLTLLPALQLYNSNTEFTELGRYNAERGPTL